MGMRRNSTTDSYVFETTNEIPVYSNLDKTGDINDKDYVVMDIGESSWLPISESWRQPFICEFNWN